MIYSYNKEHFCPGHPCIVWQYKSRPSRQQCTLERLPSYTMAVILKFCPRITMHFCIANYQKSNSTRHKERPCTDYKVCNYTLYNSFLLDCVVYSLKKSSLYIKNMKNKWKELIGEHLSSKKEYLASKNILYDV